MCTRGCTGPGVPLRVLARPHARKPLPFELCTVRDDLLERCGL